MKLLRATLKAEGWAIHIHKRRTKQLKYVYAARREGGKVIEVYLAPQTKIAQLTPDMVRSKLKTKK